MKRLVMAFVIAACGSHSGGTGDDSAAGDDSGIGAEAGGKVNCTGGSQCSNGIDDDGDGAIDSLDIQCTGPCDDDEGSFATGIPGDNIDPVKQDCFFDGNSGAGNDGCDIHVCCLLGATTKAECPIGANRYNPADCPPPIGTKPLSQMCIDFCGKLTPPGCDCFGCCHICNPANPTECYDIATNPSTSPNCTIDTISDPSKCLRCTPVPSCGTQCGGCVLCPGQDPGDLPPECGGMTTCPIGTTSCANGAPCPSFTYCDLSSQCCVGVIL